MPKRKIFEELSKSQKNKRLRQFQIKSENLLDACTSKTCEISESNCYVANNKNVTDNNNSSCSILDNINNSEINNPIDNNDIDKINDNDIEMNHLINTNDIDDNNENSDISDDSDDSSTDENLDVNLSLSTKLCQWITDDNISRDAAGKILRILKTSNHEEVVNLPLDPRTLLGTPEAPIITQTILQKWSASDKEKIEKVIKSWFQHAGDRLK